LPPHKIFPGQVDDSFSNLFGLSAIQTSKNFFVLLPSHNRFEFAISNECDSSPGQKHLFPPIFLLPGI
jgi:hypothetical protein